MSGGSPWSTAFWGALHVAVGGTDVHAASFHVCSLQPLAHYCLHRLTVSPLTQAYTAVWWNEDVKFSKPFPGVREVRVK